jgi:hypothetical protein
MVWTIIRTYLQTVMSSSASSTSSTKLTISSSSHLTKNESGGWKWEVNHDGVIWSWYHPYPSVTSTSIPPTSTPPTSSTPTPIVLSHLKEQTVSKDPTSKYTLVDYWYTVHDGPIIPTINDY